MDRGDVIGTLRQYHSIIWEIRELQEETAHIRATLYAPASVSLSAASSKAKGRTSRTEAQVARVTDLDARLLSRLAKLQDQRDRIESMIDALESDERRVLRWRYIAVHPYERRYTWMEIGRKVGYTDRMCQQIHKRAVEKISLHFVN